MTYTDEGTRVPWDWCPQAFANGLEWSARRQGHKDRFDCLYRHGAANKALWRLGALAAVLHAPKWAQRQEPEEVG